MVLRLEEIVDFMVSLNLPVERLHKLEILWGEFCTIKNVWEVFAGWKQLCDSTAKCQIMAVDLTSLPIQYN
jgi:hypothetical protein